MPTVKQLLDGLAAQEEAKQPEKLPVESSFWYPAMDSNKSYWNMGYVPMMPPRRTIEVKIIFNWPSVFPITIIEDEE